MSDELRYSEGECVVLEDVHHMHNPEMKKNQGREGEIHVARENYGDKEYLIRFEGSTNKVGNRWWVNEQWLCYPEEFEDDD